MIKLWAGQLDCVQDASVSDKDNLGLKHFSKCIKEEYFGRMFSTGLQVLGMQRLYRLQIKSNRTRIKKWCNQIIIHDMSNVIFLENKIFLGVFI